MWPRVCAVLLLACTAIAQTDPVRAFEAASVKPVEKGRPASGRLRGGPGTNSPGQLTGAASLKALLLLAYELKSYQITGPAWMESERYEIAAKIPAGASRKDVALMLRSLLAERFHLQARLETRELPIYSLVVAKSGPRFRKSPAAPEEAAATADDGALPTRSVPQLIKGADGFPSLPKDADVPRSYEVVVGGSDGLMYKLWARRETMQQLADRLSSQLNRAVIDRTQLREVYDFALAWTMESVGGSVPRTDPPPDEIGVHSTPVMSDASLSLFSAVQAQLGLRLEAGKAPLEMLIVDRVEKVPAAN
jgi:uncharacterized protein (TIGR03435 family)